MVKGLGWKVVWWVERDQRVKRHPIVSRRGYIVGVEEVRVDLIHKRYVYGQRDARTAWRIYWALKGKRHVVAGPELWNGRARVL